MQRKRVVQNRRSAHYGRILWLLAFVMLVLTACQPSQGQNVTLEIPTRIPSPTPDFQGFDYAERTARLFLDAWVTRNYEAMYDLLIFASREATPLDQFIASYESAAQEMRLREMSYNVNAMDYDDANPNISYFNYNMSFVSGIVGSFTDNERTLSLVLDPSVGDWRVAWSIADIFPEMRGGNRLRLIPRVPRRGSLYDRNGEILADQNGRIVTISVVPQDVPQMDVCLNTVVQATNTPLDILQRRLSIAGADWEAELGQMELAAYEQWQEALVRDCNAIFGNRPARQYLFGGNLAPHVIGYVGYLDEADIPMAEEAGFDQDSILGRAGIEASWDETLRGRPGGRLVIVTPGGIELRLLAETEGQPSQSLYLTLDAGLQQAAMRAIQDTYELYKDGWARSSRGGSAVVMDVNTGAILAMVSYPTYDLNAFTPFSPIGREAAATIQQRAQEDPRLPLLNRVTLARYQTGSVMKVFSSLAVADSGVYALNQRYSCSGIWQRENGLVRVDWLPGGHGTQTLAQGITNSCNPYFYEVGYQMNLRDPNLLPAYLQQFGLGNPTGLTDIPEEGGFIGDPEWLRVNGNGLLWSYGDAVSMSIGQGFVEVTLLQVVRGIAAIANGGTLYRPQLVESARLIDQINMQMTPDANGNLNVRSEVIEVVREGMCNVTVASNGTAEFVFRNSQLQTIGVCGKTGTAEDQGVNPGNSNAWFAAYAPREAPQIAVVVMIENSGQGSEIAAPIAREILEYYFFGLEASIP
ncbi:MAG: penicillin-binding transpeptidase domain-containing protein [bacterium]|nr:penicillin-binding transpeptidase domain-containing protein [bacterium]